LHSPRVGKMSGPSSGSAPIGFAGAPPGETKPTPSAPYPYPSPGGAPGGAPGPGPYPGPPPSYSQSQGYPQQQQQQQQPVFVQQPGSSVHVVHTVQPTVVAPGYVGPAGNCPNCRAGILVQSYTFCGICLAICFFPLGVLCCLLMTEKKCTNCRATF